MKNHVTTYVLIPPALFVFLSSSLVGQDMPYPKPTAEHQLLANQAGKWSCDVSMFFQGPDGPPSKFQGEEVNELLGGGLYLKTTIRIEMGDRDFEGHSLIGFDPESKSYRGTWVDNFTSVPSQTMATYNEQERRLVEHRVVVGGDGDKLQTRAVTTWIDDETRKYESYLVVAQGDIARDVKLMEMTATKSK